MLRRALGRALVAITAAVVVLLAVPATAQESAPAVTPHPKRAAIDRLVQPFVQGEFIVGLSVGVIDAGAGRSWGYGRTGRMLANALAQLDLEPSHIVEVHPRRIGQRIRHAEVITSDELAMLPGRPVVASVAGAGARREIREALAKMNYREGRDFVCAA